MYSYGPPHMAKQKQDDQLKHTYSSYVGIRDVALKTSQRRWMIGRSDERGSGISVLAARDDDDDDDMISEHISLITFLKVTWAHFFPTVKWFQVFLSNTNNSICICLNTVKWCQALPFNSNNSTKHQSFVYTVKWSSNFISSNSV